MSFFKKENILVIPDLHSPFTRNDFLNHCIQTKKKYNCNKVIFLGDMVDNHYSSFHETNPDGLGAYDELKRAIDVIHEYYEAFPKADVCIGNHDRIILRKAMNAGLSNKWIKGFDDVLKTPNWNYNTKFIYNNVLYAHGEGSSNLINTVINSGMNIVRGHYHTKFEIIYAATRKELLWGMNAGCGIDDSLYAFDYAKFNMKKSILGCGVVLDNGKLPILEPMNF